MATLQTMRRLSLSIETHACHSRSCFKLPVIKLLFLHFPNIGQPVVKIKTEATKHNLHFQKQLQWKMYCDDASPKVTICFR